MKELFMEVNLVCSDQLKSILTELLKNRDITLNANSDLVIVEKSYDYDPSKLALVFDMSTIDKLMSFLDSYNAQQENKQVISGKSDDGYEVLPYKEISYFEGIGNNVYAVNADKKYKIKEKLYELEPRLKSEGFIRVSKSFIVNIVKIDRIQPWFNGKLLLKLEDPVTEIDVTRKYVKDFKAFLGL